MKDRKIVRGGFTLAEIIIAVAIVAVLVGAAAPLIYRQLQDAKEEATGDELAALRHGLLQFYQDTGRFPAVAEGLAALFTNPGVTGWKGPYVGGQRFEDSEVLQDAFGFDYLYDPSPTTIPAGAADVIVASCGPDGVLQAGGVGGTWILAGQGDDLLTLVTTGPTDRRHILVCRNRLELIGDAAVRYYEDHADFPDGPEDLLGDYLADDPELFLDPWFQTVTMTVTENGNYPPDLVLVSGGPDQAGGGGDNIQLTVSAVPPGRAQTIRKVRTAQQALTSDPILALAGDWTGSDRPALHLAADLDQDGWGRPFQVDAQARLVFSMGPDGLAETTDDNIPSGMGFGLPGGGGGGGSGDDGGNGGDDGGNGGGNGDNGNGNGGGNSGNGIGNGGGDGSGGDNNGNGTGGGNNGNGAGNGGSGDDDDEDEDDDDDGGNQGPGGGNGRG